MNGIRPEIGERFCAVVARTLRRAGARRADGACGGRPSKRSPASVFSLDRCPLELRAEDACAVCLPPVIARWICRRILRRGEQSKRGALQDHHWSKVQ